MNANHKEFATVRASTLACMSREAPVLLLGFNRPEKMRQLIDAIRDSAPKYVLLAVDGPRKTKPEESDLVRQVQHCASLVDWTQNVDVLFRDTNLGLRSAVTEAVTWATSTHGKAIVLEDDCIPGPSLIPFLQTALAEYAEDSRMAHINGYSLVPRREMIRPRDKVRLTRYIESYAWATWERAWVSYEDSLDWALHCPIDDLAAVVGSRIGAIRWKINFRDAARGRINTWAYRWMASIWAQDLRILAPNSNLCGYDGHDGGTHTFRKPRWDELPVEVLQSTEDLFSESVDFDENADAWTGRKVFRENYVGLLEGVAASGAMALRSLVRD